MTFFRPSMKFLSEAAIQDFIEAVEESLKKARELQACRAPSIAAVLLTNELLCLHRLLRLCEPMECPECGREIEE